MVKKNVVQQWSGRVILETMFRHSKSEDIYPVLHATDGVSYRLHREFDGGSSREAFAPLANRDITLTGKADNLRGHRRIVVRAADLLAVIEGAASIPTSEKAPEVSALTQPETDAESAAPPRPSEASPASGMDASMTSVKREGR